MALHMLPRRAPQLGIRWTRRFSTSPRTASYADTLPNLKIGAHTRVLFQGFTGMCACCQQFEIMAKLPYRTTGDCQRQGILGMGHQDCRWRQAWRGGRAFRTPGVSFCQSGTRLSVRLSLRVRILICNLGYLGPGESKARCVCHLRAWKPDCTGHRRGYRGGDPSRGSRGRTRPDP